MFLKGPVTAHAVYDQLVTQACAYLQDKETAADYYFDSYAHFGKSIVIFA